MNPADIVALSHLLDEALVLPPVDRQAWLAALPPEHQVHATALRDMLAQESRLAADAPFATLPRLNLPDDAGVRAGDRVGPYRLLHEIGRGGMAVVWLAVRHDGTLTRTVALKMPRQRLTGPAQAERFERERDVLAMLAHPQIAHLYDAGITPSGHPFLVLEHVNGQPITDHCDARCLDATARIRLFLQVLAAVDHAHKHLVVHRDLKPSNVFVDAEGQVKLLDFGIAKLMPLAVVSAGASTLTRDAGSALTPRYAAPEQVAGGPVSTATDVYALGVLLFELMTGTVPHHDGRLSMAGAVDALLNTDAVQPSRAPMDGVTAVRRGVACAERLRELLAGDLDTILLKALRKHPGDRYGSAERFADDLRAWLAHRPIAARPATALHQVRLFTRRHRGASIAAVLGVAGALVFAALALVQYRNGIEQFVRAEAVRDFMFDFVNDAEVDERRAADPTGREMLESAVQRARTGFGDRPRLRGELLAELGRMRRRLGDEPGAMGLLHEAVALLEAGAPAGDASLNKARSYLADGALADGRVDDAASLATSVIARCTDGPQCAKARFYAHTTMCSVELRRGHAARALQHARDGVRESETAFGPADEQTALALHTVAIVARQAGQLVAARSALDEAERLSRGLTVRLSDRIAMTRTGAVIGLDLGDYAGARDRARALAPQTRERDEQVLLWRLLAEAQLGLGVVGEAIDASARAIALGDASGRDVQTLLAHQAHARAVSLRGDAGQARGELAEVLQGLSAAGYAPGSLEVLRARRLLAEALFRAGEARGALQMLREVSRAHVGVAEGRAAVELAQTNDLIGCVLRAQGQRADALPWHREAAALLETSLPPGHPFRLRNDIYRQDADVATRLPGGDPCRPMP